MVKFNQLEIFELRQTLGVDERELAKLQWLLIRFSVMGFNPAKTLVMNLTLPYCKVMNINTLKRPQFYLAIFGL